MENNCSANHDYKVEKAYTEQQIVENLISVIVPVYNVAQYLNEAIESVINQTYEKLEIILVDDGSTDSSGKICDGFLSKDTRIKVIHQVNKGLSAARNAGLDICKGEYISFLDPDDAFCIDMLEKMLEKMQIFDADIVECDYALYQSTKPLDLSLKKHKQHFRVKHLEGKYTRIQALNMQFEGDIAACVWNKLYRRKIWENQRFREGQNYEDVDIILPVIDSVDNVYLTDEILLLHRKLRQGSITSTHSVSNMRDKNSALKHYKEFIDGHIPGVFKYEHLTELDQRILRSFLAEYFTATNNKMSFSDEALNYVKTRVEESKKKVNLKECDLKTRGAYFIYSYMPGSFGRAIYKAWIPVRLIYRKVLNK